MHLVVVMQVMALNQVQQPEELVELPQQIRTAARLTLADKDLTAVHRVHAMQLAVLEPEMQAMVLNQALQMQAMVLNQVKQIVAMPLVWIVRHQAIQQDNVQLRIMEMLTVEMALNQVQPMQATALNRVQPTQALVVTIMLKEETELNQVQQTAEMPKEPIVHPH
jgi:hypothetical protein